MGARVQVTGLKELQEALGKLPAELRAEGLAIVRDATNGAAAAIRAQYPVGPTGNLRAGVKVTFPSSDLLVGFVASTSPHSHLYEFGTQQRSTGSRRVQSKGVTTGRRDTGGRVANRGRMPVHKVTPQIGQQYRARMFDQLKALVTRHGFVLSE